MKRLIKILVFIGLFVGIVMVSQVIALADNGITDNDLKSEVGIEFKKESRDPFKPIPPIYDPPIRPIEKPRGQLPRTGELLTSFIILLIGISILIVFVGVANLQRVYYIELLE
ncbi:hypothetical protein [Enterococcus rotai]|uniref:hypothetical protein n=1 Tax=Enterococcus rotai TaxID=118060 RepID=UPI0035C6EB99